MVTPEHRLALADFAAASPFGEARARLAGLSVILYVRDMALAAAALIDLDGFARRIVLAPPGWGDAELESAALSAEADAIAHDRLVRRSRPSWRRPSPSPCAPSRFLRTSGARDRMGAADLGHDGAAEACGPHPGDADRRHAEAPRQQWATFYDIRRYGGLQIFARAFGSGSVGRWPGGNCRKRFWSGSAQRRNPYFRHALALAPGVDERRTGRTIPSMCASPGEIADDAPTRHSGFPGIGAAGCPSARAPSATGSVM